MPIIMVPKEREDELRHGLLGTTKKREGAKYIAKVPLGNGKFRYFYNQLEWKVYNSVKSVNNKVADAAGRKYYTKADKYEKETKTAKKKYDAALKDVKKLNDDAYEKGKNLGIGGNQVWTKESKKAFKKADAKRESTGLDYADKKYRAEFNKKKGDESLYGTVKKAGDAIDEAKKKAKNAAKKGKKKLAKLFRR